MPRKMPDQHSSFDDVCPGGGRRGHYDDGPDGGGYTGPDGPSDPSPDDGPDGRDYDGI